VNKTITNAKNNIEKLYNIRNKGTIHIGDVIHHQDQLITFVNFNIRKTRNIVLKLKRINVLFFVIIFQIIFKMNH